MEARGLLNVSHLSQLHELPNLCDPGQEPFVDLQGLLAVTLLHLEVFLCMKIRKALHVLIHGYITEVSIQRSSGTTDLIG